LGKYFGLLILQTTEIQYSIGLFTLHAPDLHRTPLLKLHNISNSYTYGNVYPLLTRVTHILTRFTYQTVYRYPRLTQYSILPGDINTLVSAVVVFLFLAGLWFTGAIINGPNFHPKLTLAAPTIGYSVSCCVSC